MKSKVWLLALLATIVFTGPASGVSINYELSGHVTRTTLGLPSVPVGSAIRWVASVDSGTAPVSNMVSSIYKLDAARVEVDGAGYIGEFSPGAFAFDRAIYVTFGLPPGFSDQVSLQMGPASASNPTLDGNTLADSALVVIFDSTQTALSSGALPVALDIADFDQPQPESFLSFIVDPTCDPATGCLFEQIAYVIDEVTVSVPEPGVAVLIAPAVVLLGWIRRRKGFIIERPGPPSSQPRRGRGTLGCFGT